MAVALTRRAWMTGVPTALLATAGATATASAKTPNAPGAASPFRFGFNTYTIHGQKKALSEEIDLVAAAGYDGIEPWLMEIDAHVKAGGTVKDLAKRIQDRGLVIYNVIGFPEWAVDDDARRQKGLEVARRGMDLARQIGCRRIAAPPVGATDQALDPRRVAERYRALLELGARFEVTPMLEIWGRSQTLGRLSQAAEVAIEAAHPGASILADIFHLYKGGSPFEGLALLNAAALPVFHMNDYPADPPRATITDAHRVYPGDGVGPVPAILRTLRQSGFDGFLSLELFNPSYWEQDAAQVVRTGLEKLRAVARVALA